MANANRAWLAPRSGSLYPVIFPLIAGGIIFGATLLPWFNDPLGAHYTAWQLAIDLGWQVRSPLVSYGLLSSLCALFMVSLAWKAARSRRATLEGRPASIERADYWRAAVVCLLPALLFMLQYLLLDMNSIAQLSRHELQWSLTKAHFGYGLGGTMIPVTPLNFDSLTLQGRLALIVDHQSPGFYLPFASMFLLLATGQMVTSGASQIRRQGAKGRQLLRWSLGVGLAVLGVIVLGRAPAGLVANYQAQHLLSTGNYAGALKWLDTAHMLSPELDQLSAYHIERGQALYYLRSQDPNDERIGYLASTYIDQKDYLSAYQELMNVWNKNERVPWVQDELTDTLVRLAEQTKPLQGSGPLRQHNEEASLPWLEELLHIDSTNVYAQYTAGRIKYDMHDYASAAKNMQMVIDLSKNDDLLSNAYAYLGLSSEGQGDFVQARRYLFKAVTLDYGYRNNTAREELSGMR